ncbi:hypothetical protein DFH08DRAFT_777093 [Mycena albidolilacea]|uniref:DUF6699 domain-containing protein n=1 Tax=Mycena albidolilacea TaxID=1033008 RepID=A0AAD7A7R2_9AGAR|nr:hypothetical protein DFH08DRAFT_777093 [Mycena albidolilacea]
MQRHRRARRPLPSPRSAPPYTDNGFVYPIRPPPFFSGPPWFAGTPLMPTVPVPPSGVNMNTPSALAWQQHLATHFIPTPPPTFANTPAWPAHPPIPLEEGVVAVPADTLHWTPGTFPALPFGTPVPLHIHPALIPNPINPTIPQLQWDLLHAPELARLYTGRGILKKLDLKDDAVFPVADKVWIVPDDVNCPILAYWMQVWGPIVVEAEKGVKIRDLLDGVKAYFSKPLTRQDFRLIRRGRSPLNPTPLLPLRMAAVRRIEDAYELPEVSKQLFRRIDVLGAFRCWGGARPVVMQDGTWRLVLTLLPYVVPRVA